MNGLINVHSKLFTWQCQLIALMSLVPDGKSPNLWPDGPGRQQANGDRDATGGRAGRRAGKRGQNASTSPASRSTVTRAAEQHRQLCLRRILVYNNASGGCLPRRCHCAPATCSFGSVAAYRVTHSHSLRAIHIVLLAPSCSTMTPPRRTAMPFAHMPPLVLSFLRASLHATA